MLVALAMDHRSIQQGPASLLGKRSRTAPASAARVALEESRAALHHAASSRDSGFQPVLDLYGGLVWSLARRSSRDYADAEDAVQDVFLDVWLNSNRYDPALGSETNFVSLIARRRIIDRGRKREARPAEVEIQENVESSHCTKSLESVEIEDEAAHARAALGKLRPVQQSVLRLAIFDGLSHDEIARMTKLPLGTVKTHVRCGLARVRQLLGVAQPLKETA